jgi:hypothetical protein
MNMNRYVIETYERQVKSSQQQFEDQVSSFAYLLGKNHNQEAGVGAQAGIHP